MSIQLHDTFNFRLSFPAGTPWPATCTHSQIAFLLKLAHPGPTRWIDLLALACERGELDHTTTTERVLAPITRPRLLNTGKPRPTVEIALHHIAAAPVARWLEAQDVQPGELLQAWFKSQGVGVAAVEAEPAPAKKETVPDRNARWLRVWDEESPRHAPGSQAAAIAKIVAAEGVERATVKKALQTAEKARDEARRGGNVSSMPRKKKDAVSLQNCWGAGSK